MNVAVVKRNGEEFGLKIDGVKLKAGCLVDLKNGIAKLVGPVESIRIVTDSEFSNGAYAQACTLEKAMAPDIFITEEEKNA